MKAVDSFSCLRPVPGHPDVFHFSLPAAQAAGAGALSTLPYSLRVLAEHLLRHEDGAVITADAIHAFATAAHAGSTDVDVSFFPGRLMMQDSSGLPVLADFVALDEAVRKAGADPTRVSPRIPIDLVVDHAVEVDHWGSTQASAQNLDLEFHRHADRYRFLRWVQQRMPRLRVVPPGTGICHQLNLEVLADVIAVRQAPDGRQIAGFDSLLGTDSHTTMVNALSVFGWGVGGVEATAAALGEPVVMKIPEVVGVRLRNRLADGVLATDLALALTAELRKHDLVLRVVEFCGPGVHTLSIPDRATIANMAPEYGATMGFFPADARTVDYLRATGRPQAQVQLVEAYLDAQWMLHCESDPEPHFHRLIDFDLASVAPTLAGPRRPHDALSLASLTATVPPSRGSSSALDHGAVVIAAITSCTNTSNPRALVAAGLLARNALARGLRSAAWTKTSFAPGSRVASGMLERAGLQSALNALGFHVVGHGCMTCMGNSGPLADAIETQIREQDLSVAAVLSGNRNFEGRIHPRCKLSYLASPPMVVALAIAGTVRIDLSCEPLGVDEQQRSVFLRDIWPSDVDIDAVLDATDMRELSEINRRSSFDGPAQWIAIEPPSTDRYPWDDDAGFIRRPPFLSEALTRPLASTDILGARPLLLLGDNVTTDHISPVSRISPESEAGRWLLSQGVDAANLASFSARRLNHDVMLRGGFANPRIHNLLVPGTEGGITRLMPDHDTMPIHDAAATYAARGVPVVVIAGRGYGAGSARDWAAKVTRMLGIRAVIARSFERIHRTNLVAFGVLPLTLPDNVELSLDGTETFDLIGVEAGLRVGGSVVLEVQRATGARMRYALHAHIETDVEVNWLKHGGLLPKVMHHVC
ncbi:aconitate hydratase AcnA [Pandoraea sp. ISTKB]|uniref:aconitate hydratase AcnA n=1 Tax=Pandoraea sp. ISTKB TaxID=1586708 RepID=UPI000846F211|nr:aconitate hydratase AcnA [Pandoraea sp. ISTKB]ODP34767.1 aconitate hydratase 1 [Pandoraea sp. ISTKB]